MLSEGSDGDGGAAPRKRPWAGRAGPLGQRRLAEAGKQGRQGARKPVPAVSQRSWKRSLPEETKAQPHPNLTETYNYFQSGLRWMDVCGNGFDTHAPKGLNWSETCRDYLTTWTASRSSTTSTRPR